MFIALFTTLLLTSDVDFYDPVLNYENEDFIYKVPLDGELDLQFEKCPMTHESLIVIRRNQSGDLIAIREPVSTIEISL
jgi:hypothetical protein